jgi:UDPglucose 6-dehydrogenase
MKVSVIGAGYVGLVSAACFAKFGFSVSVFDKNEDRVRELTEGTVPIYEPGLDASILSSIEKGILMFTTSPEQCFVDTDAILIAVGTPTKQDCGNADLSDIATAIESVCLCLRKGKYVCIVMKSTVPVGTGLTIKEKMLNLRADLTPHIDYDIVSNPEFLREGSAIHDFMMPDRIIVGLDSKAEKAKTIMTDLYDNITVNQNVLFFTDIESAELIKYASNSFLAVKISFINEIANLCEKTGANITDVSRGMGLDSRIAGKFLNVGPGYGGSCFPKDTMAVLSLARNLDVDLSIIKAAIESNDKRKIAMGKRILDEFDKNSPFSESTDFGELRRMSNRGIRGKAVAVLGLTFKPETDDVRESSSFAIIRALQDAGAIVKIYDPMFCVGSKRQKWLTASYPELMRAVLFASSIYEAVNHCEAVVLATEWSEFRSMDVKKVRELMDSCTTPLFFDFRNVFNKEDMKMFRYISLGRS